MLLHFVFKAQNQDAVVKAQSLFKLAVVQLSRRSSCNTSYNGLHPCPALSSLQAWSADRIRKAILIKNNTSEPQKTVSNHWLRYPKKHKAAMSQSTAGILAQDNLPQVTPELHGCARMPALQGSSPWHESHGDSSSSCSPLPHSVPTYFPQHLRRGLMQKTVSMLSQPLSSSLLPVEPRSAWRKLQSVDFEIKSAS